MIFMRELAKKLNIKEFTLERLYLKPENNLVSLEELQKLKEIFISKKTNCSLIKARKIEKILKNLENKVA
ncbi:MAG: hypothetical protein PHD79_10305 [Aliarcobacter sp.]|nr:hypothetical protein [Aliarcobacter sp.]